MHRLSMNELTTYRWSFEEDVIQYCKAGLSAIGVWRRKIADFGEEKGVELLCDSGLRVSNLLWAGGFTGSDGRGFDESVDDAREAIRLASAMRAGCLVVCTGGRNNHISPHSERILTTALEKILPLAEALDVTLALEPMHASYAEEWTLLTDLSRARNLVDAYDCDRLKLAIDTYHIGHDAASVDVLGTITNHIAIVHLADCRGAPSADQNRCRLGDGSVPLQTIVSNLTRNGYDGDFDVELVGSEIEQACYHGLIEHSRNAVRCLLDVASPRSTASVEWA